MVCGLSVSLVGFFLNININTDILSYENNNLIFNFHMDQIYVLNLRRKSFILPLLLCVLEDIKLMKFIQQLQI